MVYYGIDNLMMLQDVTEENKTDDRERYLFVTFYDIMERKQSSIIPLLHLLPFRECSFATFTAHPDGKALIVFSYQTRKLVAVENILRCSWNWMQSDGLEITVRDFWIENYSTLVTTLTDTHGTSRYSVHAWTEATRKTILWMRSLRMKLKIHHQKPTFVPSWILNSLRRN